MALDDDTLRAMLAARTPGEWEMRPRMWEDEEYYVEVRGAPPGYLGCRYHNVGGTWEPVADAQLWAAAPALAAEVLRLRAEIERRDADDAESECREIERHQRMCAALDIPEEDRAYATDEEVEAAAIDAVCERDALAAEVLRLRAERDVLRHERDEHAHKAGEWEESHDIELARAERVEAAARAHLAAADAFSTARRTDAADVPTAEARALAARECLAGLVGYTGIGGGR